MNEQQERKALPPLPSQLEALLGVYWQAGYDEGTGHQPEADPNETLSRIREEVRGYARAALAATPAPAPEATPCVDPFCACRGGPCAECPEGQALAATPAQAQQAASPFSPFESWWLGCGIIGSVKPECAVAFAAGAATKAEAKPLSLGRELFKFDTFPGWVNHSQRAWKAEGVRSEVTICVDAKGRPCRIGRDFMQARDDGAFPVRVYMLRAEDDPAANGIGASTGGKP